MNKLRKLWKFFTSMPFGMILLGLLAVACIFGSVLPQNREMEWYFREYDARTAALIYGLNLDDVFHSDWLMVLTVILCCNLMLCNLLRGPGYYQRWLKAADPDAVGKTKPAVKLEAVADPEGLFRRLHMLPAQESTDTDGKQRRFCSKNRIGIWGAWVCHLGILLLILGYVFGQSTKQVYTVYGVPGQTRAVGETGYVLSIDEFKTELHEDGTPKSYTTKATMIDPSGRRSETATVGVNEPGSLFGYSVYQNSTGSAARVTVRVNGELVQDEVLCKGDYLKIQDTPAAVFFDGYDPAAPFDDGVSRAVYSYYLYDMNRDVVSDSEYQLEGEAAIKTDYYEVRFSEPQSYTLLQLKLERYSWLALLGALIVLIGLILAFYVQPRQLLAVREENGWTVLGFSRKAGPIFADQVLEAAAHSSEDAPDPDGKGGAHAEG